MGDAQVVEVPGELAAELRAVVGLDALDGDRQASSDFVDERDPGPDRVVFVDLENPVSGGFINRGELVEAAGADLEVFDVDLDGPAGLADVSSPPRAGSVSLERDPWPRQAPNAIATFLAQPQDQGLQRRGDAEGADLWSPAILPKAGEPELLVSAAPEVELAPGDAEEAAGEADVVSDFFVVLDDPKACLRAAEVLGLCGGVTHPGPPLLGWKHGSPGVQESP